MKVDIAIAVHHRYPHVVAFCKLLVLVLYWFPFVAHSFRLTTGIHNRQKQQQQQQRHVVVSTSLLRGRQYTGYTIPSTSILQEASPVSSSSTTVTTTTTPHIANVLLVECGFGNDSHGQNATKAAIRACRNAIEFNSVSIQRIIPGGYNHMKVHVILAVPPEYVHTLDIPQVATVFPYGQVTFEIRSGGMIAPSGRVIETLGDRNDDMVIVCAAVQVGY